MYWNETTEVGFEPAAPHAQGACSATELNLVDKTKEAYFLNHQPLLSYVQFLVDASIKEGVPKKKQCSAKVTNLPLTLLEG